MKKGFTLLEIIITLGLLALLVTPIMVIFNAPQEEAQYNQRRQAAFYAASSLLEEIGGKPFEDLDQLPAPPSSSFGLADDAAEQRADRQTWDDLDDYQGLVVTLNAGQLILQVAVAYLEEPAANGEHSFTIADQPTNFKLVTIAASWPPSGNLTLARPFVNFYPAKY